MADYDAGRIRILKEYYDVVASVKPEAVVILEHFCCDEEEKELAGYGMKLWRDAIMLIVSREWDGRNTVISAVFTPELIQ